MFGLKGTRWKDIQAVAAALLEKRTMTGEEVARVVYRGNPADANAKFAARSIWEISGKLRT